MNFYITTKI